MFVSATQRIVWTKGQECVLSGHQHLHPILQSFVWLCLRFGGFLSIIGRGFIGFKAGSRGDRGSRVRISWERETLFSQGVESRKIFSLGLCWPNQSSEITTWTLLVWRAPKYCNKFQCKGHVMVKGTWLADNFNAREARKIFLHKFPREVIFFWS